MHTNKGVLSLTRSYCTTTIVSLMRSIPVELSPCYMLVKVRELGISGAVPFEPRNPFGTGASVLRLRPGLAIRIGILSA